jgi:hypothetical protein
MSSGSNFDPLNIKIIFVVDIFGGIFQSQIFHCLDKDPGDFRTVTVAKMGGQQSTRRITVINDEASGVIKVNLCIFDLVTSKNFIQFFLCRSPIRSSKGLRMNWRLQDHHSKKRSNLRRPNRQKLKIRRSLHQVSHLRPQRLLHNKSPP